MSHNPFKVGTMGAYVFSSHGQPGAGGGLSGSGGTNYPSGGGGVSNAGYATIDDFSVANITSGPIEPGNQTKEEIERLSKEVSQLSEIVDRQADQITELYEIINAFRQNFARQTGKATVGYWDEVVTQRP